MNDNAIIPIEDGVLLVARPNELDTNFDMTVVFLLSHHSDQGSMGLVINKPSLGVIVDDDSPLLPWLEHTAAPVVPFVGGPVEPHGFICLVQDFGSSNGVTSVDIPTQDPLAFDQPFRLFHGYAGWGAGQLDAEFRSGAWYIVPSEISDVFTNEPETLWNRVLSRQRGALGKIGQTFIRPELN